MTVPIRVIRETELANSNYHRIWPDRLTCGEIARALARKPGRAEIREKEADCILDDIMERWERGEIPGSDFLVRSFGTPLPPEWLALFRGEQSEVGESRPELSLAEALRIARRQAPGWEFPKAAWRDGIMFTAAAAKRYLEHSGHDGAPRLLHELFFPDGMPKAESPGMKPAATEPLTLKEIVSRYIVDERTDGRIPSQKGLLERWKARGKRGRRDDLIQAFKAQMGDAALKRGRPTKSPEKSQK